MSKLFIILLLVLIILMIIQTALFVVDGLIARIKNKENAILQEQLVEIQKQIVAAQNRYNDDVQELRKINDRFHKDLESRDSIIHHQTVLINAYKLKDKENYIQQI